jgi:hypothetical protein
MPFSAPVFEKLSSSNRWDALMESYKQDVRSYKPHVLVTIYGSYHPPEERDILQSLRNTLINDGYIDTRLVDDLEHLRMENNLTPLQMSEFCLRKSDINLLIFTRGGKRLGLVKELDYLADINMCRKHPFSILFDEVKKHDDYEKETSIPALSRDDVEDARLSRRTFHSVEELNSITVIETYKILRKLARKNMIRIS